MTDETAQHQDDQRNDGYQVEEQIGFLLRKAHQRASAIFQGQFNDHQITPTQFSTLVKLRDRGEASQNHLGRLTAMDPATIQGVTRRLIDRGLVATKADEQDKRKMLLSLTPEGVALIEKLVDKGKTVTELTLAPISAEEQKQLLDLLKKIT
ncbi:MarR family transcriptional regulator [Sneathiella sp. P13V-1]|uniref:MarR family winged helix-turn-helix transcriptional regulator n=1 Tax=Sneathiella sp. P13V-1 TaxID=2697366 RepID=UPI00187B4E9C|nr:MarR family transcriptional regulator [Sneathiella sp. P13V-1]MBE7636714.1 MarR family transcriptional regulator [Sneathiella sp. P13V-1]